MRRVWAAVGAMMVLGAATPAAEAKRPPGAPDIRELEPSVRMKTALPPTIRSVAGGAARRAARATGAAGETPPLGTVRYWLGYDDVAQSPVYYKPYTLRAVGEHIEVWVTNDLSFPAGDCRNDSVTVTDAQLQSLVREFDGTIFPLESAAFSTPPARDGANALLAEIPAQGGGFVPAPPGYWGGAGEKIVTLVDNVRDTHYYDRNNAGNHTYIAGFHFSLLNEAFDRNVMTIDAYDWLHRTGANPPNAPSEDPCTNRPARPFLYEGVFAHEYQHLLEYYEDPDEALWVNEGLADWAMVLTGYTDPRPPITEQRFSSHIQCFLGYAGVRTPANPIPGPGGPENSLDIWGDQGDREILCDYGAAHSMMEMLHGRYGASFMTALHRDDANGFAGLAAALRAAGARETIKAIVRDWVATAALDGVLDRGAALDGRAAWRLQTDTLDATINWDTPEAYDTPGAPPNGADFVRLRNGAGTYLKARELRSLTFDGAATLPPDPVEWTVSPEPPGHPGDPALFSGAGSDFDRSIVREVAVPTENPTLTFETRWATELGWDFGFVQVSTDGGRTWKSLANADTTAAHDPEAIAPVVENLPGFTGESGGWRAETFDLSAYAGRTVLLGFRYITDPAVNGDGWWVDDVAVGGTPIGDGTSLEGWRTITQVAPTPVAGYTVQLLGYTSKTLGTPAERRRGGRNVAFAHRLRLANGRTTALGRRTLQRLLGRHGRRADVVSVLVTQHDPTESAGQYARYALRANGVRQPGG